MSTLGRYGQPALIFACATILHICFGIIAAPSFASHYASNWHPVALEDPKAADRPAAHDVTLYLENLGARARTYSNVDADRSRLYQADLAPAAALIGRRLQLAPPRRHKGVDGHLTTPNFIHAISSAPSVTLDKTKAEAPVLLHKTATQRSAPAARHAENNAAGSNARDPSPAIPSETNAADNRALELANVARDQIQADLSIVPVEPYERRPAPPATRKVEVALVQHIDPATATDATGPIGTPEVAAGAPPAPSAAGEEAQHSSDQAEIDSVEMNAQGAAVPAEMVLAEAAQEETVQEEAFYLIGPGDGLDISVRNQPELSRSITVRPDGRLTVPLVEDLVTNGLTPQELARVIEEQLAVYLKAPRVSVTVTSPQGLVDQRIRVLGEVVRPTSMPYRAGITLLDAVIEIGGLDPFADGNGAKIIRRSALGQEEIAVRLDDLVTGGDASANLALAPGDIIVVPEGFFSGDVLVDTGANSSLTFTDNINLVPDDQKSSAYITRLGNSLSISADLARFTGNLNTNYDLVFVNHDSRVSVDGQLTGSSTTEVARDHLFFDLNTGITRSLLNTRQSSSASRFVTTNRDTTVTLSASPYLVHRLGKFADARWRYIISPVLVSGSNNSNTLTHSVSSSLTGGRISQTLGWSLNSRAGQTIRSNNSNVNASSSDTADISDTTEFADTSLGLTYGLWRGFELIGSIGYVFRTSNRQGDNNELNGISWDAGFRWQPNPRSTLSVTYGQRDRDNTFSGTLSHQIGDKTSIRASYRDQRLSDQERFIQGVNNATVDAQGNFIDPQTGQPFNPNDPGTSFDDTSSRTRTLTGTIQHEIGRNTFSLSGSASRRSDSLNGDQETNRATLSGSRRLSQRMSFSSSVSIEGREFSADDREDDIFLINSDLSYRIAEAATANFSYSFQNHDSSNSGADFIENTFTVGVSVKF